MVSDKSGGEPSLATAAWFFQQRAHPEHVPPSVPENEVDTDRGDGGNQRKQGDQEQGLHRPAECKTRPLSDEVGKYYRRFRDNGEDETSDGQGRSPLHVPRPDLSEDRNDARRRRTALSG